LLDSCVLASQNKHQTNDQNNRKNLARLVWEASSSTKLNKPTNQIETYSGFHCVNFNLMYAVAEF